MLRRLGSVIWSQSREMRVINYSNHMVYELYTNHGYIYVTHDKSTNTMDIVRPRGFVGEWVTKKPISTADDLSCVRRDQE